MYQDSGKTAKYKEKKEKQYLINKNIQHSKFLLYKPCITLRPVKNILANNFNLGNINSICSVFVYNQHAINVLYNYCLKGLNANLLNGINPCALQIVGKDFYGQSFESLEGILDEEYILRTNFVNTVSLHNPYPLKGNECVYNKWVTVIRNPMLGGINLGLVYRFGLIVASTISKPKLIDDDGTKMSASNFLEIYATIECVFQTAIAGNHNMLVLTPFGYGDDDVPQEDIIKIYNLCIFKYGHRFKFIMIAVPKEEKEIFELYQKEIIKPQDFLKEIDDKYEKEELKLNLKQQKKQLDNNKNNQDVNSNTQENMLLLMNMINKNPMMMQMLMNKQNNN
jgi:hypothetical protein